MLWVRLCAGTLTAATLAFAGYLLLKTDMSPAVAVILFCAGVLLACIVPFPATNRLSRERVFRVCLAYTALIWGGMATTFLQSSQLRSITSFHEIVGFVISALAVLLTAYAYQRKQVRRRSAWSGYLKE